MTAMLNEEELQNRLQKAADAIASARHLTAFTGAGISVESGIPPFRGPGGVWEKYDPDILDLDVFIRHPDRSWPAIRALFTSFLGTGGRSAAQPNKAHQVLAQWEKDGRLKCTITQNIDGLHAAAGCHELVEYHGHCRTLTCLSCEKRFPLVETLPPPPAIPTCPVCGGLLKPDFIFFGEGIPYEAMERGEREARLTDCMVLVGTSGVVHPAAGIPPAAKYHGATLIEINPRPSPFTEQGLTDIFLPLGAVDAFTRLEPMVRAAAES